MKYEKITSAQNPKIRELTPLQHRSAYRRETGLFVVEGRREVARCLDAGFRVRTFFYCPEIISEGEMEEIFAKVSDDGCGRDGGSEGLAVGSDSSRLEEVLAVEIPAELYDKVAYRGGTEGIMAVAECREMSLSGLRVGRTPLIVVLEGVEKPGNLGAVLRSADAAGVDAVLLCDSPSDIYNPNVLRASTGTVFSVPLAEATSEEAIEWLRERGVKILSAQLQDSDWYYDTDMVNDLGGAVDGGEGGCSDGGSAERLGGVALVMGTEDEGLTDKWRAAADAHIKIPMLGRADSLNVSVSAAVLLYEAVRQRHQRGLL